MQITSIAKTNV